MIWGTRFGVAPVEELQNIEYRIQRHILQPYSKFEVKSGISQGQLVVE